MFQKNTNWEVTFENLDLYFFKYKGDDIHDSLLSTGCIFVQSICHQAFRFCNFNDLKFTVIFLVEYDNVSDTIRNPEKTFSMLELNGKHLMLS